MLEICVDSLESAKRAITAGATVIEICSNLQAGGFTPTVELVAEVIKMVKEVPVHSRPKIHTIIRCSLPGDDFIFSDRDMDVMIGDMESYKEMGVDGFVFGALTSSEDVDEGRCIRFVNAAAPKKVIFSRAFDCTAKCNKAVDTISGLGFDGLQTRLLTCKHRRGTLVEENYKKDIAYLLMKYSVQTDQKVILPKGGVASRNMRVYFYKG